MAVEIPLTQGKIALVSDEDAERVMAHKWYANPCGKMGWYAARDVRNENKRSRIYLHRFIVSAEAGMSVDHINDDTLDNRRENLRQCSHRQNLANRRSRNATGYRGVALSYGKYAAKISVREKVIALGAYDTPQEAARAYDKAAREHFGEYARLNFPEAA